MSHGLDRARFMRAFCLTVYALFFILNIILWVDTVVLSDRSYTWILFPLVGATVLGAFLTSYMAVQVKCPKCSGRFFSKSNSLFSVNVFTRRCTHCRLGLYY